MLYTPRWSSDFILRLKLGERGIIDLRFIEMQHALFTAVYISIISFSDSSVQSTHLVSNKIVHQGRK